MCLASPFMASWRINLWATYCLLPMFPLSLYWVQDRTSFLFRSFTWVEPFPWGADVRAMRSVLPLFTLSALTVGRVLSLMITVPYRSDTRVVTVLYQVFATSFALDTMKFRDGLLMLIYCSTRNVGNARTVYGGAFCSSLVAKTGNCSLFCKFFMQLRKFQSYYAKQAFDQRQRIETSV